jgi:hypothetical protein
VMVDGGRSNSPLLEIALVLVHLDHVSSFIVHANHSIQSLRFVSSNGITRSI